MLSQGVSTEAFAHSLISAGGPVDNGTKAEAVRFHDDKVHSSWDACMH